MITNKDLKSVFDQSDNSSQNYAPDNDSLCDKDSVLLLIALELWLGILSPGFLSVTSFQE